MDENTADLTKAQEVTGLEEYVLREIIEQADRGGASLRARRVLDFMLKNGACTTSELQAAGYNHPPRAVRDLKDSGVDIVMVQESYTDPITGTSKRRGRYTLVGITGEVNSRKPLSKRFRDSVVAVGECEICRTQEKLQADHRVPFAVGGETIPHVVHEFQALCRSCNRDKSWSCEHCPNWDVKNIETCMSCMWSSPRDYQHVAGKPIRLLRGVLTDPDLIKKYDAQRPEVGDVMRQYLSD